MEILVVKNYEAVSTLAAALIARQIKARPNSVLALPTGQTPLGLYQKLTSFFKSGSLSFSSVKTFNLDEYVGLAPSHVDSYYHYMQVNFFSQVNLHPDNIHFPDSEAADLGSECSDYEEAIAKSGGIDLLILGIGHDGHIGFCEPGGSFAARTHIATLTESTRATNAHLLTELTVVPEPAITMGIATILQARSIILLASGADKAAILKQALTGPVTESVPASVLQTHLDVTVIMDEAAAS